IELNTLSAQYDLKNTPMEIRELKQLPLIGILIHMPGQKQPSLKLARDGSRTFIKLEDGVPVLQSRDGPSSSRVLSDSLVTRSATRRWRKFVYLGFFSILPSGIEHVLFVCALLIVASGAGLITGQLGIFAGSFIAVVVLMIQFSPPVSLNHAGTLATFSAAAVGMENVFTGNVARTRLWFIALCGALHGYHSSTVLKPFMLRSENALAAAGAYSLGILGAVALIAVVWSVLTGWLWTKKWYYNLITVPVSMGIVVLGIFFGLKAFPG
ncbi:MAG: hypothetical protein GF350_04705, partial [Chitinivibrionales bacterium]|nr:hypothetical protein [Chitinivibrionales bacterium]